MTVRRYSLRGMPVIERVRMASETSVIVRTVLLGSLAIAITLGGVFAGALVVAPAVAKATQPEATAQLANFLAKTSTASSVAFARLAQSATSAKAALPPSAVRFALPALLAAGFVGVLSVVLMRRRMPHRSLSTPSTSYDPGPRTLDRLTPRSSAKIGARNTKTPREVESLAATGASPIDIAWRTGLPIDAVQLLLALARAPRQLQPPTA